MLYFQVDTEVEFTNISLEQTTEKKKKVPKRILHFSDGVLEEYSTDEEEEIVKPPPVDPVRISQAYVLSDSYPPLIIIIRG